MCPKTRLLCELAHEIFSQKLTEDIATFVQASDYQYFWKRADEFIQSSYSHIHFGHYKAAARDRYLSALEAAKLSLTTRSGIPLERWGSALTVLLEKEFGNIYIEKMLAICLMEADFNWLNNLIFAKPMMDQAYDAGNVPLEQFTKRGTQAAHGVLCKVLFCDYVCVLHIVAGIPSVDLGNCYNAVSHPIASIALQAFKVPLLTVVLSLSVLQTMTFYLRTGYGMSKNGYMVVQRMIRPLVWGRATGWLPRASLLLALSWMSCTNVWVMPRFLLVPGPESSSFWPRLFTLMTRIC
jgi:hypothetical protein